MSFKLSLIRYLGPWHRVPILVGQPLRVKLQSSHVFHSDFIRPMSHFNQAIGTQTKSFQAVRSFSSQPNEDGEEEDRKITTLMNFTPRGMPNFWYSIKNLYMINFLLRTQIDRSFEFKSFVEGAKQALLTVSSHLANNRLEELVGLVDSEALKEITENYKTLSVAQHKEFEFIQSDIVLCFAHHVRIDTLKEEFTGTRKHIVYFFMVFDCIRNLEEILREKARARAPARDFFQEFAGRKYICNYEFKREYIEGGEASEWIITKLLHIREQDLFKWNRQTL